MTFLDVWIGYALFGITAFSLVFVWAVRTRQFSNLDRGRYIPLDEELTTSKPDQRRASRIDIWALRLMVLIAASLLIAALVVGIRNA